MQDKLKELTNRLYTEGLSKGQEEGELILERAKKEAGEIVEEARKEAARIIEKAHKDAGDIRTKVESDLKMASAQTIQATKKDVENLVISRISDEKISAALKAPEFLKEIIKSVAEKFSTESAQDLSIVLPESLKKDLESFVKGELAGALKNGVEAQFSKKISGGFTIGPKDGGYFISFTDGTFNELIGAYLRPVTKKLLFG